MHKGQNKHQTAQNKVGQLAAVENSHLIVADLSLYLSYIDMCSDVVFQLKLSYFGKQLFGFAPLSALQRAADFGKIVPETVSNEQRILFWEDGGTDVRRIPGVRLIARVGINPQQAVIQQLKDNVYPFIKFHHIFIGCRALCR